MLSSVEHEKRLITSGSGFFPQNFKFPPFIFYILFQHENQSWWQDPSLAQKQIHYVPEQ